MLLYIQISFYLSYEALTLDYVVCLICYDDANKKNEINFRALTVVNFANIFQLLKVFK